MKRRNEDTIALEALALQRRRLQSLYGKLGGLQASASGDARARTANARAAFIKSWEAKVDPDRVLDPVERQRRADAARRQHYVRMVIAREEKRLARMRRGIADRNEAGESVSETPQALEDVAGRAA